MFKTINKEMGPGPIMVEFILKPTQYKKLKLQAAKANISIACLAKQMVEHCLNPTEE